MKLSFVIPVFRNEGSITPTYQKLFELVQSMQLEYELIFVNDGSDDNSLNELIALHQKDSNVKVLSFSRNFGQVPAMVAGCKEVTGDAVILMSADLQEPVELISAMIAKWKAGTKS